MRPKKITITKAARLMGKSPLFVREGLIRGVLPIGEAIEIPRKGKDERYYSYFISPPLLAEYIGVPLEVVLDAV